MQTKRSRTRWHQPWHCKLAKWAIRKCAYFIRPQPATLQDTVLSFCPNHTAMAALSENTRAAVPRTRAQGQTHVCSVLTTAPYSHAGRPQYKLALGTHEWPLGQQQVLKQHQQSAPAGQTLSTPQWRSTAQESCVNTGCSPPSMPQPAASCESQCNAAGQKRARNHHSTASTFEHNTCTPWLQSP
jgi:hypothetical protein